LHTKSSRSYPYPQKQLANKQLHNIPQESYHKNHAIPHSLDPRKSEQ